MTEHILKDLIKCKLKMCDRIIEVLPDNIKEPVQDFKTILLEAVTEAAEESKVRRETNTACKKKGLENIEIE